VREEQDEGAKANEEVDEPFDLWPGAKDHMDDIPVVTHVATECDEAPVEAADDDEDE